MHQHVTPTMGHSAGGGGGGVGVVIKYEVTVKLTAVPTVVVQYSTAWFCACFSKIDRSDVPMSIWCSAATKQQGYIMKHKASYYFPFHVSFVYKLYFTYNT